MLVRITRERCEKDADLTHSIYLLRKGVKALFLADMSANAGEGRLGGEQKAFSKF